MSNAAAAQTFEILLGHTTAPREKTTIRVANIAAVADYLRPGLPDVTIVKRGYTTSQIRSCGRIVGSVQELG